MATFFKNALVLAGLVGAGFASLRGTSGQQISSPESTAFVVIRQIPVEVVEDGSAPNIVFVGVEQTVMPTDHLEQTIYIRDQLLKSQNQPKNNANSIVFYTALDDYLRAMQGKIMDDPTCISGIEDTIVGAYNWFAKAQNLAENNFNAAFYSSIATSEIARLSNQFTR